jgi:hypothetical protein
MVDHWEPGENSGVEELVLSDSAWDGALPLRTSFGGVGLSGLLAPLRRVAGRGGGI